MDLAKIVGLDVTPTTWRSRIRSARLPVLSRSRLMSSIHTETPAADNFASASLMMILSSGNRSIYNNVSAARRRPRDAAHPRHAGVRGRDDAVGGQAELLVNHLVGGARAVVLDAQGLAVVADELAPPHGNGGLDRHPRLHVRRQDFLPVGVGLLEEPLAARHRDHPGRGALGLEHFPCGKGNLHFAA